MQTIEIEEIKKYVDELAALLQQNGQGHVSDQLRVITQRFKDPNQVRPAVYALDQAVRQWLRKTEGSQQGDVSIRLTAQFLADACKNALSQGSIRSLPPTRRESARSLGRVAGITLAIGLAVALVPVLLLAIGVNWIELLMPDELAGTVVGRGKEVVVAVNLSSPAPKYDEPLHVSVEPVGRCRGRAWEELSCEPSERLWSDGIRHTTFHVVRPAEVNGILIAVRGEALHGQHGRAELLVYADKDAASGEYLIPLEGAYLAPVAPCSPQPVDAGTHDAGHAVAAEPCDPTAQPTVLARSGVSSVLFVVP